jgi:putative ABC transport system permease protein
VLIVIREFSKYDELPLEVKEGRRGELARQMREGQIVLGSVLSQRTDLHAGDTLELSTDQGLRQMQIAGVVTDYQVGGMMLYMDREAARKILQISGADLFLVRAEDARVAEVEAELVQLCRSEGLLLQSYGDLAQLVDRIMGGVLAGLWAILALEFIVAGFGIANTLTMNVLEQTREIGLLRVIAMTRSQVRKMIFAQAALIGLSALVLGMPGGVLVAWLINLCTQPLVGQPVEFGISAALTIAASAMALVIVLAAAWLPAERAVRLEPGEALAYE